VVKQNDEEILADFEADKRAVAELQKVEGESRLLLEKLTCEPLIRRHDQIRNKTVKLTWVETSTLLNESQKTLVRFHSVGRIPTEVLQKHSRMVEAADKAAQLAAHLTTNIGQELGRFLEAAAEYKRVTANFLGQNGQCRSGKTKQGRPRIWTGVEGLYLVRAVEEKRKNKQCTVADAIRWAIAANPVLSRSTIRSQPSRTLQARYQEASKYWSRDSDEQARAGDRYETALDRFEAAMEQWIADLMAFDAANETLHAASETFHAAFKRWKSGLGSPAPS
jgi:hypothetical protein